METTYQPKDSILKKYADVLVKYALNSGAGIKPGQVVQCVVPDIAKPLLVQLQRSILEAGGHPILKLLPTGIDKDFYDLANDEQLTFFPKKYMKARVDLIDHSIGIIAEADLKELTEVPPEKILKAAESKKKVRDWFNDKEYAGNFTWTLAAYATPAMAQEAQMSHKAYWNEIIRACYLDQSDPVTKWKEVSRQQQKVMAWLNGLKIETLRIQAQDTDITITLGQKRRFVGGSGRNIPSFEIFTSPDWRGTTGHIYFNQPLYRYGNLIRDVRLEFAGGRVIKSSASQGQKLLREMLKRPNADKLGEFSLTDSRLSPIKKFMADTLFDENMGGRYGNTHLAVGMSYKDCFDGDARTPSKAEWKSLGFNDSGEHCDIISTTDRTVTASLKDGSSLVIYQDGKFTLDS